MPIRQCVGAVVRDEDTAARQIDRRLQQIRKREFSRAVFVKRQRQPRGRAGDANAERGVAGFRDVGLAVRSQENTGRGRVRRSFAIVDRDVLMTLR